MSGDEFAATRVRGKLGQLTRDPKRQWQSHGSLSGLDFDEAGVLIPLAERDGEFYTVFTHRSEDLENHSGEVSFPGGRSEPEDNSLAETALREAYEEIALHPSDVDLFGALVEMPTITGFRIVAYAGEFPAPYELIPSPHEIETMFEAPLRSLADPERHRLEREEYGDELYEVHYFEHEGHTIWGATGYLLYEFLDFLGLADRLRVRGT